uniref:Uncharacterized protein n=1 Tax=Anopheles atroparvus TaxID=41427 RepID=A0A182J5H2_ANOAO
MDSDREASCTPPLPMTEDLLPEQLSKFHSPMVPENNEHEERPLSSPATKTVPDAPCVASVPDDGPGKRCPDGSDRKSKEEGGKREKKSDDSTPRRQSSKEAPSNEKHKSDGKHGGSSKAKSEKHKNASQERDKGKERHHRSRNHHRRKTRSRSKESTSLTKGSPGRPKQAPEEDGSRKQRKEGRRSNDEERKKKSKSRRRSSRSAEATGNNDERHRGHSRSHSRSRSRRRESVRRDRRSSSPARDSRPRRGDFRDGPVVQQTSHFKRDFNFPGRRGFHAFQRGGRFQGFPRRGSPFWMRPGPTRAPGATLSAMRYTKTLPTISWRNWTEPLEPANSADRSPVRKIRPITPAIAALQEYDGSEDEATSNSDAEAKLKDGGQQGEKFHDAKMVCTPPRKPDGEEEVGLRHIKLEKLDEGDYADEEEPVGEMKFDCSIVKKEPLTEEDEATPAENATAAEVEEKVMVPCPAVNNAPAKPKFSCSFLEDLSSGALMLDPELLASPERQESGDEAPEPEEVEERAARGASESPDTDDYAANWETEETLSTSPSKQNLEDASPRREGVGGTPPTSHKPDQPEDATNGSVEQNGEEKRAHLKPRSMHEEIIPLDDLLNMQNQLKSYKSKLEEAEKLKAATLLKRTDGKSPSEPAAREGLFADKLADEYQNFMQSLAQTPASGEAGRKRKRSSSTSSSSSSSSSSSDSSSDSSSSSASSSSSSSSTSDSDDDHSSAEEEDDANAERKNENSAPTEPERTEDDPAAAAGAIEDEKPADSGTPPHRPNLFIPEYLLPKVPTPPSPSGPPTQQTPTKIYSIRDDSVASEGTDAKVSTIKPLELDRETPIKLQLPSKSRMLPVGGASALLGQDDEEGTRPPTEPAAAELEQKRPKDRRRSSEEKSSRHRQKRSRDRHDRKRSDSRQRSRDRQTSGASSPKRKSRDRDKRSSRKERSSPSRKERSSQRHGSRSPRRRTRSPRARRRSVSKSRSRSRSRYHSLSPSQRHRPPSPRGGRSPVDHRRAGRSRRRYSVDREWNTRRSRSPYGGRRPPSPKDAPPMGHGSENQIDIITSTGASPNVHSPVTGYKKSLADSTISDAELESQKRKLVGYGGGAYYGPLPTDGMHLDPGAVPGASASADGGDESSPKRISLDDRINIVLGMNGTVDGGKAGGKHHHGHGQHMHHHHHHHHAPPYGTEYPAPAHDVYQQRNHHAASGNYPLPGYGAGQEQYGGSPYGAYGSRGPPTSLPPNASVATPPPYYPGSGRGPPPSWAPRSHPYQGYPMAFAAPPHHRPLLPGEMYRFPFAPPTAVPPASSGASDGTANAKSQVKQVGNVLEIVPSSAPLSAPPGSDGTLAGSTHLASSAADGSHPGVAGSANGSSTTSPAEAATLGDTAPQQTSTGSGSSALVTPKILTAEELQQRHDRRQELKKKIRAEREKKRLDKKQRKERLQQDIKRLMGPKAPSGGTIDPLLDDGAAGGGGLGVGGERGGSGGGGGSASSDEEFETIKQADLLASLGRSYEKSILKLPKPPNAAGSGTAVKKSVLFADGMAPGDKSSSSADEAKEKSPNKQSVAKQRKKLRRQRTLKISGKKRLIDRMKLPELEQEPEEIDPELENLPPPPPPPGSPPPELQQPRCLNPPVVRMIDFREGFHGIGLPLPVPPVTMGGPPPPIHLVGANAMGPAGASSIPLPVPPVVSMSVPPGPVPVPAPGYRQPPAMPQPHHHHHLLPSHLATQRPTSPHGSVHAPLHHTHPPPHLFHHPPHIGHGSLHAPPPQHAYHQHHHHHHAAPPPQTALPPPSASSALITISGKKRTATANGSNSTGVNSIESIVSTAAGPTGPIVASPVTSVVSTYDGTPPV